MSLPSRPAHPLLFLVAVCLVLLAAFLGPGRANAASYGVQGIAMGDAARQDVDLDAAHRTGAKLVRIEATWSALEPSAPGVRDPSAVAALDRVIDGAYRRGMRTVLVISRTPCWASAAPAQERRDCSGPDANRDAVARYRPEDPAAVVPVATFLASRYATRLAAFQVWNEPDQANEKYWAGPDKVGSYVAMVRALYGPLKQAAPRVPVIVGSFVGTNGRWLRAMYDAGIKGSYDGLAVQFYRYTLYGLRVTRDIQRARGDSKPLWLTEFGYTSCYRRGGPALQIDQPCVSRAVAARATADVLAGVRRRPYVAATIQYALADDGPGGYTFGLFDAARRVKPTFTAVRRVLTGRIKAPARPTIRLRARRRGQVVASGTASLTELLTVRVRQRGVLRLRATLLADRQGRWRFALPAALGTRGLAVQLTAGWAGRSRVARR